MKNGRTVTKNAQKLPGVPRVKSHPSVPAEAPRGSPHTASDLAGPLTVQQLVLKEGGMWWFGGASKHQETPHIDTILPSVGMATTRV